MQSDHKATILVVLSDDQDHVQEAGDAEAGATVHLPRHAAADEIGRAVLAAAATGLDAQSPKRAASRPAVGKKLSGRELEVLELAGRGEPGKAIAAALGIRERTVKFHLAAAMRKLGTRSRTEAVMAAVRSGQLGL